MMKKIFNILIATVLCGALQAQGVQNRYEEVIPYETVDGNIVVGVKIKGKSYKFLFDTGGRTSITPELAKEHGIEIVNATVDYPRPGVDGALAGVVEKFAFGENIFRDQKAVFIIEDEYLTSLGLSGILGLDILPGFVLTIDSRESTLTVSTPYKPPYMAIKNRTGMPQFDRLDLLVGDKSLTVCIDLNGKYLLALTDADYATVKSALSGEKAASGIPVKPGYKPAVVNGKETVASAIKLANKTLTDAKVYNSSDLTNSYIGGEILDYGVLAFDIQAQRAFLQPFEDLKKPETQKRVATAQISEGKPVALNKALFFSEIFDYRQSSEWAYKGKLPAIIDFWAEWCGPCKAMNPLLEQLAEKYAGQIVIYQLNVDNDADIANYFKANALPMFMIIPMEGNPTTVSGMQSLESFEELIKTKLLK